MTANGLLQIALFLVLLLALVKPLGSYMANVYEGRVRFLAPVERLFYRLMGVDPAAPMSWKTYAAAMLLFNLLGPTLPVLLTLQKTAAAYAPAMAGGVQPFGALAVLGLAAGVVLIWRFRRPQAG